MESDEPIIRPVREPDFERWLPLWQGYQEFYRARIPEEATRATWNRFFDEREPVHCLVAERNGKLRRPRALPVPSLDLAGRRPPAISTTCSSIRAAGAPALRAS